MFDSRTPCNEWFINFAFNAAMMRGPSEVLGQMQVLSLYYSFVWLRMTTLLAASDQRTFFWGQIHQQCHCGSTRLHHIRARKLLTRQLKKSNSSNIPRRLIYNLYFHVGPRVMDLNSNPTVQCDSELNEELLVTLRGRQFSNFPVFFAGFLGSFKSRNSARISAKMYAMILPKGVTMRSSWYISLLRLCYVNVISRWGNAASSVKLCFYGGERENMFLIIVFLMSIHFSAIPARNKTHTQD